MYSINGIDLTGSQYRELKSLVGLHSDEERASFAAKTLHPYENQNIWNPNGIDCYKALESLGLIEGTRGMNVFLFYGVVTQAGIDFVQDFAAKQKEQKTKTLERQKIPNRVISSYPRSLNCCRLASWSFLLKRFQVRNQKQPDRTE